MAAVAENSVESIEVVPTGTPVGAEIRGLDLRQPVSDAVKAELVKIL